jgi:hypothetical protein
MPRFENVPEDQLAELELEYAGMLNTLEHQMCFIISELLAVREELDRRETCTH